MRSHGWFKKEARRILVMNKRAKELQKCWEEKSILELWHNQVIQHHKEMYKGIGLAKFPQDLWTYEKLINDTDPEIILEIGTNEGGFTRWLYDRLVSLNTLDRNKKPRTVIGLDINIGLARRNLKELMENKFAEVSIKLLECNLLDKISINSALQEIQKMSNGKSVLIIEDSGHTYETTKAALDSFSGLLKLSEWFIVEDTCVDLEALRECKEWPRGALKATEDFLLLNSHFERSNLNHMYEITCHPFGFLQKTS